MKENIARFNEIGTLMGEPDADFDALMEEMGKLQDAIDAANGWTWTASCPRPWTRCSAPIPTCR